MRNKCRVYHGYCEEHQVRTNDEGKCPVGEVFSEKPHQFQGMCECCLSNPAEEGDFICMECISRMLLDMESEETDKY